MIIVFNEKINNITNYLNPFSFRSWYLSENKVSLLFKWLFIFITVVKKTIHTLQAQKSPNKVRNNTNVEQHIIEGFEALLSLLINREMIIIGNCYSRTFQLKHYTVLHFAVIECYTEMENQKLICGNCVPHWIHYKWWKT